MVVQFFFEVTKLLAQFFDICNRHSWADRLCFVFRVLVWLYTNHGCEVQFHLLSLVTAFDLDSDGLLLG